MTQSFISGAAGRCQPVQACAFVCDVRSDGRLPAALTRVCELDEGTSVTWRRAACRARSAGPSEGPDRDLRGGGEQSVDLLVEAAERDGRARHVERGAVVSDVVPADVDAALRQQFVRVPVQQVQLADRGATEPVDHQRHIVAGPERQVGDDGFEQLINDLVGAGQLLSAAPRYGSPAMTTCTAAT